jgi:hypothetical protein
MAKFLTGNELNAELEKTFEKATDLLILISPYIKLHDRFMSTLKTKQNSHKMQIIIVFGKNEDDLTRSMKYEDFNFFKEFPNIEIRYEKRLHAKYYANESSAILTSMNLYSFSQDNNIEAGVLTKASILGNLASNIMNNVTGEDSFDNQAWTYFKRVIDQSELLFHKTPQYESQTFGLTKKYKESKIEVDKLTDFFSGKSNSSSRKDANERNKVATFQRIQENKGGTGYCIRTGKEIPFNAERPFTDEAFRSWSQFKNDEYPEKYCHFSGEPSNGETSKARPILRKNWNKAKAEHGF